MHPERLSGWWSVCAGVTVALVLAGCGGDDPETQVERAESQVARQQQALTEAQHAFEEASSAFCRTARDYVVALDRYGDLLHATAPTVGDVKDGGADLATPAEDAMTAAGDAVDAQHEVITAEQDLADAQAALNQAKRGSQTPSPDAATKTSTPTPTPLAPPATVTRVKAAASDFEAAQDGVTDQTPLTQASQEFNAAAVALQLSWMQLVADAGCLTADEQQQAEAAVHGYTEDLQRSLDAAGYDPGPVDGVYGEATVEAVKDLQRAHDLPVTGAVDKATDTALRADVQAAGGAAAQDAVASTAAVQQTLRLAGYWTGPVDGNWTPALTDALSALQKDLGVEPTGAVDAATLAAVEDAIAARATPAPSAEGSPSAPTSTPTGTGSPSSGSS